MIIVLLYSMATALFADENGFKSSSSLTVAYDSLKKQITSLQIKMIRENANCLITVSDSIGSKLDQSLKGDKGDATVKKTLNLDLRIILLSKVQTAMNSKFNPKDLPVKPPLPDGLFLIGQKLSKDEETRLKQKYENSLKEYGEKLQEYSTENKLCSIKEDFVQTIIILGSDAFKYDELERILNKYNIDSGLKNIILNSVKKIQAQMNYPGAAHTGYRR